MPTQQNKKTFLPASFASAKTSPKARWVSALGHALMIIEKAIPHDPRLLAGVSSCKCGAPFDRLIWKAADTVDSQSASFHHWEAQLSMLPQLRLSFQMVMRSPFVLWEELFDTSSRISENHWLLHEPKAFAKCAAAELLQSMGDWGSPNKQHLAKWIARGIACDVWLIKNANSFFKRTLSRFSQIQTSRKQCICIHKYQNLLGVMPQPPRTVMEHHRLYTMERKHFLVQKIVFIDFHKLHQAYYKSGRHFSPKHLPLLRHSS